MGEECVPICNLLINKKLNKENKKTKRHIGAW